MKDNFLKRMFQPIDMTEGKPSSKIVAFAVPMLIGNIAQQLYSTVDSIVVGRYVGDNALAAVGSAAPIYNLLLVLFVGISTGATIMVSQYVGARVREDLSHAIGTSMLLTILSSLIIMILGPLVARPLLILLQTPESILDWCEDYLVILFVGLLGMAFYNILSGILRGLGDSLMALVYLLVACALNIVLDILFVAKFDMGVAGVALATVIAQVISSVFCLIRLAQMKEFFDLKWKYVRLSKKYSGSIIKLGLPSGLSQAIFSMSMVVIQSLTNQFGETIIAANVIVMRVDGFAMMPVFSFAGAMTTYAGQNLGARKYDRIHKGVKQGTWISILVISALVGVILIFGKYVMGLFTTTEELIRISNNFMRILAIGYVAMAMSQSLQGTMRGCGDTMTPMWIGLLTTVAFRVPLAYLLAYLTRSEALPHGDYRILPFSLMCAWVVGATLSAIFYMKGSWRKRLKDSTEACP